MIGRSGRRLRGDEIGKSVSEEVVFEKTLSCDDDVVDVQSDAKG